MDLDSALEAALEQPGARFICLSEVGEIVTDRPPPLDDVTAEFLTPESPLGLLTTESYGSAMTAFAVALNDGMASALTHLTDRDETHRVEVFDTRLDLGSLVAVFFPVDERSPETNNSAIELPVRRITSRMNATGKTEWIDEGVDRLLGYTEEEYLEGHALDRLHPDDHERALLSFAELLNRPGGQSRNLRRYRHADGHWLWLEMTHTNLLHTDDPHIFVESFDVSADVEVRASLQQKEALLQTLTDALPIGVLHLDPNGDVGIANPTWSALTGDQEATTIDSFTELLQRPEPVIRAISDARGDGAPRNLTVSFDDRAAACKHAELRLRGLPGSAAPFGLVLTLTDMTQMVTFQEQLRQDARTDHLTRVLNRLGIEDELSPILAELTERSLPVTMLYFDLNDFKKINDTLGHAVGDQVLAAAAETIRLEIRQTDLVGRIGGDEFVAVLLDAAAGEVSQMVDRIRRRLTAYSPQFGTKHDITVAVGVAVAEPDDTFGSLVRRADEAMYRNKSGKDRLTAR